MVGGAFSGLFGAISLTEFLFIVSPEKGALQMGTVRPASSLKRIGFVGGHIALLTTV
jgi:hypothetical protein